MPTKKIELKTILLADQVIEAKDGKKSIISIFDRILVRRLPTVHPKVVMFITLFGPANERSEAKIVAQSPTGKTISENELKFSFGSNGKADIIFNWEGFPVEELGNYHFFIETENKKLGEVLMEVDESNNLNLPTSHLN